MTVGDTKSTDLEAAVNEFYGTMSEFARGGLGSGQSPLLA